jgi:hypothetical protein
MRTILLCLIVAAPVFAEERTWTITQSTPAELVEVRGNLAYLRIQGNVESVPIERLSPADQQYLSSLRLKPILPGPATEDSEMLPVPVNPISEYGSQPMRTAESTSGEVGPAFFAPNGEPFQAMPSPNNNGVVIRRDPNVQQSSAIQPMQSNDAYGQRSLLVNPPMNGQMPIGPPNKNQGQNSNARRLIPQQPTQAQRQPQQQQNKKQANKSSNERRGLLGGRRRDD